jgi:hypothetical protein
MTDILVELFNNHDHFGFILFDENSEISWSNQVGGTCTSHPQVKGHYIPLGYFPGSCPRPPDRLLDFYENRPVKYNHGLVTAWLDDFSPLDVLFRPLTPLEVGKLPCRVVLAEAWIPVVVLPTNSELLGGFIGRMGAITYSNSD